MPVMMTSLPSADCGWGILYGRNAQEAGDLALIARRAAEDTETPFMNVQDGFLTTHTIENVRLPEPELMKLFVGHPIAKIRNLMDPRVPLMSGVVQNQDSYMKGKIAQRKFYDVVLPTLKSVMDEFTRLTGRRYDVVMPYRLEDADYAIVGSGCMIETAEAAVDYMREHYGIKVGLLHITCFRPFPSIEIVEALRHVQGDFGARAPRYPDDAVESATLRNQSRIRRCHGRHARVSRTHAYAEVLRRFGRSGQPRRPRRRLHCGYGKHAQPEPAIVFHAGHQA